MTTVTLALAAFASGAPAGSAAQAAARAALPGPGFLTGPYADGPTRPDEGEETGRARAAVHWTACAALHHATVHAMGRDRAEHGLAVGLEVALRLLRTLEGQVVGGWDPVGAAVRVGAATAAARMDGLGTEWAARAIGIAATQAAGLAVVAETPLGTYQHRHAAGDGLQAAHLARSGMTAPVTGLEGRRGLYALLAPTADPARAAENLGERWLITEQCLAAHGAPPAGGPENQWASAVAYAREMLS
ncbi:MmgE/PrpD family protein [Nonomuraea sp. NPDC049158]|uniref:MmgE/PrpD family protein n=1 Tax=Nonomuraea sp. NPDC049158 TaxID=3155649 RepID=UPI0033EF2C35